MRKRPEVVEKDGKLYLVIGDNAIPIDGLDVDGKPVIKVEAQEIRQPDGSQDARVKVPCLTISGAAKEPGNG